MDSTVDKTVEEQFSKDQNVSIKGKHQSKVQVMGI